MLAVFVVKVVSNALPSADIDKHATIRHAASQGCLESNPRKTARSAICYVR